MDAGTIEKYLRTQKVKKVKPIKRTDDILPEPKPDEVKLKDEVDVARISEDPLEAALGKKF